jgi:predicted TIM-barrel fold metal-dependent hydrolase
VRRLGPEAFVFSSDFPHEVNVETCKHEVEEVRESDQLSDTAKQAVFYDNAVRFYGLKAASTK